MFVFLNCRGLETLVNCVNCEILAATVMLWSWNEKLVSFLFISQGESRELVRGYAIFHADWPCNFSWLASATVVVLN